MRRGTWILLFKVIQVFRARAEIAARVKPNRIPSVFISNRRFAKVLAGGRKAVLAKWKQRDRGTHATDPRVSRSQSEES